MLGHYDWLARVPGWGSLIVFRALVERLSGEAAPMGLFASTSHEVLVISAFGTVPERKERSMVFVEPRPGGRIRVRLRNPTGAEVQAECDHEGLLAHVQIREQLRSLLLEASWLGAGSSPSSECQPKPG